MVESFSVPLIARKERVIAQRDGILGDLYGLALSSMSATGAISAAFLSRPIGPVPDHGSVIFCHLNLRIHLT
jgi:hypothetical protein